MFNRTKIICTIGPAIDSEAMIIQAIKAGANVFRFNFSHGNIEYFQEKVPLVRKVAEQLATPISLLGDLKGPEIRTNDLTYQLPKNATVSLKYGKGSKLEIGITHRFLYKLVKKGSTIFVDDGYIELQVQKIQQSAIICKVINGGVITAHKSINVPGIDIELPMLGYKDKKWIEFIANNNFDWIAASFVRHQKDISAVLKELKKYDANIPIISKIENQQAIINLDEIIEYSDGVMVARGDLGVELPTAIIPVKQNIIIKKTQSAGKIIIIATQMLESMMDKPRPTRAEATDIANATLQNVDAVMLSGESASGKYPIEAIKTMSNIISVTEHETPPQTTPFKQINKPKISESLTLTCKAGLSLALESKAKCLITISMWGKSSQVIAGFRSDMHTIVACSNKKLYHKNNLYYSVLPILIDSYETTDQQFKAIETNLKNKKIVKKGDLVIFMFSYPSTQDATNSIRRWVIK